MSWVVAACLIASFMCCACLAVEDPGSEGVPPGPSKPRHYTIPTIDLAHETHRQVVVDREPGQYLGHPTTVLLEDNKTMIAVYPKGHGRGAIVMKRSADAGLTWSERLPVPENWATSIEVPTIYRVVDPQGVRRLIMFSGLYPNRMAFSEDDGVSWTPLEPIGDFGGIVVMSSLVRLKDGRYMALFHDDERFLTKNGRRGKFRVYKTLSADGGLTWGEPEVVTEHPKAHLCEPGVVRSPDGSQLAMLLRENSRKYNSFVTFSNDEGETWADPVELPASLTGDRHVGRYAPDGRLIFVFRDTTHVSPTKGDFVAWVGTYEDIVRGREGQYRVRLLDNKKDGDCGYPGLELLPDGTFIATTYGHWIEGEEPFIVSVRFTLEELDKRALLLPKETDLFVSGRDGVAVYRIPALGVTKKGTLIAVCDARIESGSDLPNNIDLVVRRSFDLGNTWTPVQTIVDFPGKAGGGDSSILVDRDTGTIWLFYVYGPEGIGTKQSQPGLDGPTLQLHLVRSDDDGATWSTPRNLNPEVKDPAWRAVWSSPGRGFQTRSGRLYFPLTRYSDMHYTHLIYSDDHGESWHITPAAGRNTNESMVVELADGSLMVNMRSRYGTNRRAVAISSDQGRTWEGFRHDPALIEPVCQASFIRCTAKADGHMKNRLLFANPASTKREKMTVRISYDEGRTWPASKTVYPGPSAYSCLAVLPDGSIGLLYERGITNPYESVTFARFTLEWLTDGKDSF